MFSTKEALVAKEVKALISTCSYCLNFKMLRLILLANCEKNEKYRLAL